MLETLFGGKNLKQVLIFLFVNGKCYGTQLHKSFNTALTPIQKALNRLEKGGVVLSFYEGKTRLYQFNPSFPLLVELESLLKKAYTLLPPDEKKQYCFVRQEGQKKLEKQIQEKEILVAFWKRLAATNTLIFHAKTKLKEEGGWNGRGRGEVIVAKEGESVLVFHEKGNWKNEEGHETDFSNIFRWTLDKAAGVISLEHLRRGINRPVFLFHLAPSGNNSLSSVDTHLCAEDAYFGQIFYDKNHLRLNWRVIGPKKNEELDYYYS
jgi:hypothetical protein